MAELTEKCRALIDAPNFAYLATLDPDGAPQVSPVWIDRDGDTIRVNTATGRTKDRNMRNDPRVAISIADKDNAYKKSDVRGRVVGIVEGGTEPDDHIDALSKKYTGRDRYDGHKDTEDRVIFLIEPVRVTDRA
jgi:PPOX class probable F420-dependent enzyme